jgi:hypothetical protein
MSRACVQDICRLGIQPLTAELVRTLCDEWVIASIVRSLEAAAGPPRSSADAAPRSHAVLGTTIALSAVRRVASQALRCNAP